MKDPKKFGSIESDLTFVGLAGIKVRKILIYYMLTADQQALHHNVIHGIAL
jgi:hypothetical protein